PPQSAQCSGGLSPGPFCVEFACSPRVHKGFPPLRTPTVKTCKITELMSITDQRWTVHFTWSPGAAKLPTAPGGSLRKDGPGWEKAENKFTELMSIPDQRWTVHFTWSPGAAKLPTAPGGSLRKDGPGWEKAANKFTATSGLPACVCVCPVSPPYMHVCVPVCRVCH